jgi:hypothetical protein
MRNRRPEPRKGPITLAELVLDLEERTKSGDADGAFEVPAEEWANLIQRARYELAAGDGRLAKPRAA